MRPPDLLDPLPIFLFKIWKSNFAWRNTNRFFISKSTKEGPYSFYRRWCTEAELAQLNIPEPRLNHLDLRQGSRLAFSRIVRLLETRKYRDFLSLFNSSDYSKNNANDVLQQWKSLSKKDQRIFGDQIKKNLTTHSSVTRVREVHWRNENKVGMWLK